MKLYLLDHSCLRNLVPGMFIRFGKLPYSRKSTKVCFLVISLVHFVRFPETIPIQSTVVESHTNNGSSGHVKQRHEYLPIPDKNLMPSSCLVVYMVIISCLDGKEK